MRISVSFILAVIAATVVIAHELPSHPRAHLVARSFGRRDNSYTKSGVHDSYAKDGYTKHPAVVPPPGGDVVTSPTHATSPSSAASPSSNSTGPVLAGADNSTNVPLPGAGNDTASPANLNNSAHSVPLIPGNSSDVPLPAATNGAGVASPAAKAPETYAKKSADHDTYAQGGYTQHHSATPSKDGDVPISSSQATSPTPVASAPSDSAHSVPAGVDNSTNVPLPTASNDTAPPPNLNNSTQSVPPIPGNTNGTGVVSPGAKGPENYSKPPCDEDTHPTPPTDKKSESTSPPLPPKVESPPTPTPNQPDAHSKPPEPPCDDDTHATTHTDKKNEPTPSPVPPKVEPPTTQPPENPNTYSKPPINDASAPAPAADSPTGPAPPVLNSTAPGAGVPSSPNATVSDAGLSQPTNSTAPTASLPASTPPPNTSNTTSPPLTGTTDMGTSPPSPANTVPPTNQTTNSVNPGASAVDSTNTAPPYQSNQFSNSSTALSPNGGASASDNPNGLGPNYQGGLPSSAYGAGEQPHGLTSGFGNHGNANVEAGQLVPAYSRLFGNAQEITHLLQDPSVHPQLVAAKLSTFFNQFNFLVSSHGTSCGFCGPDFGLIEFQTIAIQFSHMIASWLLIIQQRWSTNFLQICPWFPQTGHTFYEFLQFCGSAGISQNVFSPIFSQTTVQSCITTFWGSSFPTAF